MKKMEWKTNDEECMLVMIISSVIVKCTVAHWCLFSIRLLFIYFIFVVAVVVVV